MEREYTVVTEQDEAGYYVVEVPELEGCYQVFRRAYGACSRGDRALSLGNSVQASPNASDWRAEDSCMTRFPALEGKEHVAKGPIESSSWPKPTILESAWSSFLGDSKKICLTPCGIRR